MTSSNFQVAGAAAQQRMLQPTSHYAQRVGCTRDQGSFTVATDGAVGGRLYATCNAGCIVHVRVMIMPTFTQRRHSLPQLVVGLMNNTPRLIGLQARNVKQQLQPALLQNASCLASDDGRPPPESTRSLHFPLYRYSVLSGGMPHAPTISYTKVAPQARQQAAHSPAAALEARHFPTQKNHASQIPRWQHWDRIARNLHCSLVADDVAFVADTATEPRC